MCREALRHLAWGGREKADRCGGWEGGGGCSSGVELGHWSLDLDGGAQMFEMQV